MSEIKIISKETLIPIGLSLAILAPVVTLIIYGVNLNNQTMRNKEDIQNHVAMDDSRVQSLQNQVQNMQNNQTKMDAKLDYIVQTLDEIKKGIR